MLPGSPFTPADTAAPRRGRITRRSVLIADKVADWIITLGGMAVILAVAGIMVFLVRVVVPLFTGATAGETHHYTMAANEVPPLAIAVDEYKTIGTSISTDGRVSIFHAPTGRIIEGPSFDFGGARATAFGSTLDGGHVAFGFADGTVRFGELKLQASVIPASEAPSNLTEIDGRDTTDGHFIYRKLPGNQMRVSSVAVNQEDPQTISEDGAAIVALDYRVTGGAERSAKSFVTVDGAGVLRLTRAETKANMLTGKLRTTVETSALPPLPVGTIIRRVMLTEGADQVLVASGNMIYRYDTRNFEAPALAEAAQMLPDGAQITAFSFLIGEQSIVVGGSDGTVSVYFRLSRATARGSDGYELVRAHQLDPHVGAVIAISPSQRGKTMVTMDDRGNVWLRHSTSEQTLMKFTGITADDIDLTPRANGALATGRTGATTLFEFDAPHPETTLGTIFGKVWYEGYSAPGYTWQSSSGTDSFEAKFSLVPLIFGTIKATVYSLLFAIPIALLGAIYTAEFLHPRVRAVVKPAMEMMASLPSVVLGFIAALILAPLVETWIAAVILAFIVLPVGMVAAAYLWQLLPIQLAARFSRTPRLLAQAGLVVALLYLSSLLGPAFEAVSFQGDFKAWVNGDIGSAAPVLFLALLPICALSLGLLMNRLAGKQLEAAMLARSKSGAAVIDLGRWLAIMVAAILLAALLATGLAAVGADARGGVLDTYVQRNTLVIGFAMGFAVIPLIYTLADDALTAVPEHLRSASLACGATAWQTATRIILPAAISGVFAAIMIGMGRAVGETMIVVMAAGNTPLLDWNLFNGLRALSANIAVELPEAVKDDTLYRVLFLAALVLFAMTFIINTVAEVIRQRFRKRSFQL